MGALSYYSIPGDFLLIGAGFWLGLFLSRRYVSLANLVLLLSLPAVFWLKYHSIFYYLLGVIIFFVIAWAHRENIIRLLEGKELKTELPKFPHPLNPKNKP